MDRNRLIDVRYRSESDDIDGIEVHFSIPIAFIYKNGVIR